MGDYYTILGVDSNASRESIKNAYRRLARENHPDLQSSTNEKAKKASSTHMAELNQAYAVLSDAKRRREYDEKLHIQEVLEQKAAAMAQQAKEARSAKIANTGQRLYVRPRHEVDPTVVKEFSSHLRASFLSDRENFSWKEKDAEGFDWALEALFWSSSYCVAARGSSIIDPATIKKVIDYSDVFIARCTRQLRKNYFLFLFPFQQLSEWEVVSAQCQKFTGGEKGSKTSAAAVGIVLLDMQHGRTLRFGNPTQEKKYTQLLHRVETPSNKGYHE